MSSPKLGQEVEINYKITTKEGKIIDSTENKHSFKFIIGSNKILKEIEDEVIKMKKGELKEIKLNSDNCENIFNLINDENNKEEKNKELNCQIELIDYYDKIKSIYEMDTQEKESMVKKLKEEGVEFFKKQEFEKSIEKFKESYAYILKINEKDLSSEIKNLKLSVLLNQCNCNNRLKNYIETIKIANEVMNITKDNMKSYYYRGTANAYLDEFDKANEDYNKLVELMKSTDDPGVVSLRQLIDTRKLNKENKEKGKMKNIFKKGLYDDNKKDNNN